MGLIHHVLHARGIQEDIKELPQTLSSWDKCMEKSYCKWPVIAGCIIAGLIIISCVWCLIRCCMCGVACCSCCCGGCGGSKTKTKRVEYVAAPPIYAQPAFQPPPVYESQKTGVVHSETPRSYHREAPREAPQYAYDNNGAVSENALPAMPTWEQTKVEVVKEEVEMDYVNNEPHRKNMSPGPGFRGANAAPLPRGTSPGPSFMTAPAPINLANQKLGFNPRGQTPAPARQYEERGQMPDPYGQGQQMGGQWPRHDEFDANYPYDHQPSGPNQQYFQDDMDYHTQPVGYASQQDRDYQQNIDYANDHPNTGYPLNQHDTGYPLDQHNTGYPLDHHNTGYTNGHDYSRELDYPADIASYPAQPSYSQQNQQPDFPLPTRSLTNPSNGGYAAYNGQSSQTPKPYAAPSAPSPSNGGYQAYTPSKPQQAPYPSEDNLHGAFDDKRGKQQEWSAL